MHCARCGVYTISPWPTVAELDAAYDGAYRPTRGRFAGPGDELLRLTRSQLARRIDRIAPPGRILDVGAGEGWLVDALRRCGREAQGIERGDGPWPSGPWAAVMFWHSLEHLPQPGAALREASAALAPGGVLAIAVPNVASMQARVFGDDWLALDPPRHLVHIPAPALLLALADCGLRVERVSHWRGGQVAIGWLHGLVGLLPGGPNLYEALRVPAARWRRQGRRRATLTIAAAAALSPFAALCALLEVSLRRGGSVYVEARRG